MYLGKVYVYLKRTVNAPQGITILGALQSLGFSNTRDVRAGKYFEVLIAEETQIIAEAKLKEMCQTFLATPVIEDYSIDVIPVEG